MRLFYFIEALLIAAALQMRPQAVLLRQDYESTLDYYLALTTKLLGNYSYLFLIELVLACVLIVWMEEKEYQKKYSGWILPFFFGCCLLLGQSYHEAGDWSCCFGGIVNILHFTIALTGYTLLFRRMIALFLHGYRKLAETDWAPVPLMRFFGKYCYRNVLLLLLLAWTPVILVSYPGNVCYDAYGQICQVLGEMPWSAHHPLLHTLIMGGLVKIFYFMTGSYEIGVFVYIVFQALSFGAALAYTVVWLKKGNRSTALLTFITGIYLFAPMYSNYASTALKDIPYATAVIWYITLLAEGLEYSEVWKSRRYPALLVTAALLCTLFRNNGIYMIFPTGIAASVIWLKKERRKNAIKYIMTLCVFPVILYLLINHSLCAAVDAAGVSKGEMLSVPFQQTARYLQQFGEEMTPEEKAAIENILGDTDKVALRYNPNSADAVKELYRRDSSNRELVQYLNTWMKMFFKHPACYVEAFFHHVYGLFDPAVSNSIRYEIYEDDFFVRKGLFPNADKVLIFLYRFADRITILSALQNVGIYVWAMFILGGVMLREKKEKLLLWTPLFFSLIICMLAPCFFNHARYAFPILFTIPFLYGVMAGPSK